MAPARVSAGMKAAPAMVSSMLDDNAKYVVDIGQRARQHARVVSLWLNTTCMRGSIIDVISLHNGDEVMPWGPRVTCFCNKLASLSVAGERCS